MRIILFTGVGLLILLLSGQSENGEGASNNINTTAATNAQRLATEKAELLRAEQASKALAQNVETVIKQDKVGAGDS